MCGIVGYIGPRKPVEVLLTGLKNLEYRGYDSAGIALENQQCVQVIKSVGKIQTLEEKIKHENLIESHVGIAHTRWATHGVPSEKNAHPHTVGNITLVHNGIIENADVLKKKLIQKGVIFQTETDTEVIAALLNDYYENDIVEALTKCCKEIMGSYALGILVKGDDKHLYAVRKNSPLIVGVGENEYFIASDIGAILSYTNRYLLLEEDEIAVLSQNGVQILDWKGMSRKKDILQIDASVISRSKQGFEHYMLKEIMEQPQLIEKNLQSIVSSKTALYQEIPDISQFDEIHIVACGSALYAGMIGKILIEEQAQIPVRVEVASEYRYQKTIYSKNTLVIFISQSGETADTIAALYKTKKSNIATLGIVNVEHSTIAREVDQVVYIKAGVEVAVATTKAYLLQVAMLSLLALKASSKKGFVNDSELIKILQDFKMLPEQMRKVLTNDYKKIALEIYNHENVFFIGRKLDYAISLEGSLKLKEVSYIHSEAYQAGELKHGTISLICEDMPVIAIMTDPNLKEKTMSNLMETEARGAKGIVITTKQLDNDDNCLKVVVDTTNIFAQPLLIAPVLQILAYEIAKLRGCEIDQPKNLAKSVTVE